MVKYHKPWQPTQYIPIQLLCHINQLCTVERYERQHSFSDKNYQESQDMDIDPYSII